MVSGKYSALAGAVSREQAIANISNNLANVSTTGYKKMMVSFESVLRGEKQINDAKGINYDRVRQNFTDFSSGPIKDTGNTFDLALQGNGFFKVLGPDGPLYTRDGAFTLTAEGGLVTQNGYPVLNDGETPIQIPDAGSLRISINRLGSVSAIDTAGNREEIGRLAIVDINDKSKLKHHDNNTFLLEPGATETPIAEPQVISGSLEMSNVNMVDEMSRMIDSHRLYEIYHKVLKGYSAISEKQDELGTLA